MDTSTTIEEYFIIAKATDAEAELRKKKHNENSLERQTRLARKGMLKRWISDPQVSTLPDDIEFGEWHAALDELQERLDECREMYPIDANKLKIQ